MTNKLIITAVAAMTTIATQAQTTATDSLQVDRQMDLKEVVVKSTMPRTRVKGNAMRTFVTGSVLEKAGTTKEMLKQVPMLNEGDNGIEVMGRGAAEIYINGRRVYDMNELDILQSDQVLHVDVVQNPGARYSASTKAVVRITTKKPQGEGISVTEYAKAGYQYELEGNDWLTVNYRNEGLDITGTMGYETSHQYNDQELSLYSLVGGEHMRQVSEETGNLRRKSLYPQLKVNYMINENHSLGARYSFSRLYDMNFEADMPTQIFLGDKLLTQTHSVIMMDGPTWKHEANFYYNGTVKDWTIDFNADGLWNSESSPNTTDEYTYGKKEFLRRVEGVTENSNSLVASKLVLTHPLWRGQLTLGGEYVHNNRNNEYYNKQGILPNDKSEVKENVYSLFAEYGRTFGKLYAQAGLRYEALQNDYLVFDKRIDEQSRKYADLFPTVTLAMPVGITQMSLSYSQNIARPSYENLNSYMIYINPYSYQGGNPLLLPTYHHNLSYNLAYRWLNFFATLSKVKDDIQLTTKQYSADNPAISLITPGNVPSYTQGQIGIVAAPTLFKLWHPQWTTYCSFQNFETPTASGEMKKMNKPLFGIVWRNTIVMPHSWRLGADMTWQKKGQYVSYDMQRNIFLCELRVQKDMPLRNLGHIELQANAINPFCGQTNDVICYSIRELRSYTHQRSKFTVSATWKFNEARDKYKGKGAGASQKERM